nr:hypothetical protein [Tanacetum cinerariifolium]
MVACLCWGEWEKVVGLMGEWWEVAGVGEVVLMVIKEIVNRLLDEVERSWDVGLSKTLMMKDRRMKKVKVVV